MLDEGYTLGLFGPIHWIALFGLTISPFRGLFWYMPVLVLSLFALWRVRESDHRWFWWLALANILLTLLINTTFNGWHGGIASGPRYQIIALPFYVLLLALLPNRREDWIVLSALTALSFSNMFVLSAVSPMAVGPPYGSPLSLSYGTLWSALQVDFGITPVSVGSVLSAGNIHAYPDFLMRDWSIELSDPAFRRWAVFNLGERVFGLRGTWSLLPALVLATVQGGWMIRVAGKVEKGER